MEFQGFQNSLPTLVVFVIAFILVAIAWSSYRKLKSIPTYSRFILVLLRSSAFLLLLLLFLNPYYFTSEVNNRNPKLLFLLDDSESVTINKGSYDGATSYSETLHFLNLENSSGFDSEFFTIGASSTQLRSPDSLKFLDTETNFTAAITQVQELEDNFDAIVLLSDGIITFGRNPVIQASNLSTPIYTIALGDTSIVRDIVLSNVLTNSTGYTNTQHLVEVSVSQNGYSGSKSTVRIKNSDGDLLDQKELTFQFEEEVVSTIFELELARPGLQQFSIELDNLEGEWSTENNSKNITIDVSDSKIKMLHVAFEIHPDVKMLRSILSEDENIELNSFTWIGNRFIENDLPELSDIDLLIFHGLPPTSFNPNLLRGYEELPSLYLQLPQNRLNRNPNFQNISLIQHSGSRLFQLTLNPNANTSEHPILELPEVGYDNLAPLKGSLRTILTALDASTLFNSSYQGVQNDNPLVSIVERGNIRRVDLSAWGWYKMYQSTNEKEREFITQLFSNIATWTSNDPDNRKLKISPAKSSFNISERVLINANLNNESGESESNATIEVNIDSNNEFQGSYNMRNSGTGTYSVELPPFSSGLYTFTATARKGDREIDTQTGEFLIEDSSTEYVSTIRNDDLLSSLANETGGSFFYFNQLEGFWSTLNDDGVLQSKEEVIESYLFPIRSIFWFILVLLLLSSEWLLRKKFALP